jgi:hypothetical protein
MARNPKPITAPETTQEEPTADRPRDASGFELDHWGLPLVGPERARRLEALGKTDPNEDPEGWGDADAASVAASTGADFSGLKAGIDDALDPFAAFKDMNDPETPNG